MIYSTVTEDVEVQRRMSEEMLDYMSEVSGSLSTSRASSVMEEVNVSLKTTRKS